MSQGQLRRAPDDGDKPVRQLERRLLQAVRLAAVNHVADASAHAFDVLGKVQGFGDQGVGRVRAMRLPKGLQIQRRWQAARVPDFKPVGKQHDLHAGGAGVVAVGNGIDDGLRDDFRRNLIGHGRLRAECTGAHGEVDFGQDEVHRLVHQFEQVALVHLIERNGLLPLGAVEVGALHFRAVDEPLRLLAKQQHGGVGGVAISEQAQLGQHGFRGGIFRQREVARTARGAQEALDTVGRNVVQRGITAHAGVKWGGAQLAMLLQVVHQRGVHRRMQVGVVGKAPADHFIAGTGNQRLHLEVLAAIAFALDVDEARLAQFGCAVELMFGRRDALCILIAILVAKQRQIDIAGCHFVQVGHAGRLILCRKLLKQERFKKTAQQRVIAQIVGERGPFGRKLLLHAADKDALHEAS